MGARREGADFFFTLRTIAGRSYRIEYKDRLTDPAWQPFGADITATGPVTEIPDPGITALQSMRYYRARVLPQP
jgi:hypothetical protein